jgi:hypothetical protein
MTIEQTANLSLIISALGFCTSVVVLYLSQLRKGKIAVVVGPRIAVYHHDYPSGISTNLVVPVSFVNNTSATATILKVGIWIYRHDSQDEKYFLRWHKFELQDETNGSAWIHEEDCHSLVLPPRSGLHKNIWFPWHSINSQKLFLTEGEYTISLLIWENEKKKPKEFKRNFHIQIESQRAYERYRAQQLTNDLRILIDESGLPNNQVMTIKEAKKLL